MPSSRARKRASGISSCESGKKKTRLPASALAMTRDSAPGARARGRARSPAGSARVGTPQASAAACSQRVVPSAPSGKGAGSRVAPRSSSARAVSARNGCASRSGCPARPRGRSVERRGGRNCDRRRCPSRRTGGGTGLPPRPPARRPPAASAVRWLRRQIRHQRGEAGILALGEGRLDAAARVVQHPHLRREAAGQALRRARQIELDDLGRAGADQEQQPDVGPALQQLADHAVEFVVGVGQSGQVALVDDGGGEARFGEDHHAGGRLDQMRAGARADDQEERVLDLAVQPDDAGQPAEHLALAALAQHRRVACSRLRDAGAHESLGMRRALAERRHGPVRPRRRAGRRAASARTAWR